MIPCSVCQRDDVADIDSELGGGVSLRAAAARFGLSKSALGRHRAGCLAPKLAAAARVISGSSPGREEAKRAKAIVAGDETVTPADVLTLSGLVSRLGRSLDRLDLAADEASGGRALAALAALSAQLHRGIESAARLQGLAKIDGDPDRRAFSVVINLPAAPIATAKVVPLEPAPATPISPDKPMTLRLALAGAGDDDDRGP